MDIEMFVWIAIGSLVLWGICKAASGSGSRGSRGGHSGGIGFGDFLD